MDSIKKNTFAEELIKQRELDKEIKKILRSDNPVDKLSQMVIFMRQEAADRDAKMNIRLDEITSVFMTTHQQVQNLTNMSWAEHFGATVCPCARKAIMKSVKNKGIDQEDLKLVAKVKKDLRARQTNSSTSSTSSTTPSIPTTPK